MTLAGIPHRLRELAILLVARRWDADYVWWAHAPEALKHGISPDVIEAIRANRQTLPEESRPDERALVDYFREIYDAHSVSDGTYNRLAELVGMTQLVNLTVAIGHWTNVAISVVAHGTPLPPGYEVQLAAAIGANR